MPKSVFTDRGNLTTLLHGDLVAVCQKTGEVELHRPVWHEEHRDNDGKRERLRFAGAVRINPNAGEAELLGVVLAIPGAKRLKLEPADGVLPDRFRVWKLVAVLLRP